MASLKVSRDTGGALYFIRDQLKPEFGDEVKQAGLTLSEIYPNIVWSPVSTRLYWVLDFWPDVEKISFTSVSDAAKKLRGIHRIWRYAGGANFRRGKLIAEALRVKPIKPIAFPDTVVYPPGPAFTLENETTLLISMNPEKGRFAGGTLAFIEDKRPPSRAYLKLWEAFTLMNFYPGPGDSIVDLGATPGGWSYVAASLGAGVTMIDRSEPDAALMQKFKNLKFVRGDGLHVPQPLLAEATVLLSDMACEPQKLIVAVREWLKAPQLRAMVCTLKFHGVSDKALIQSFAAIAGGNIVHLWHNGHELTWCWIRK